MYAMDLVLANQFLSLGSNFLSLEILIEALGVVFPKVVKCSMSYHGVSGNIENNSGMCTLPINMEEVICRINPANSALFAGLIRQIVAYLPDIIRQIVSYLPD